MGLKYAAVHTAFHLLAPVAIAVSFNLNPAQFIIAFFGSLVVDVDHFGLVLKHGIRGAFSRIVVKGYGKARRYPVHNYAFVALSALGSFLVAWNGYFLVGIFSFAVFIHLLWDLLEDAVIFRIRLDNWKV